MSFKKIFFLFVFFFSCVFSNENFDKRHILYLMHSNEIEKAFSSFQKMTSNDNYLDFETLQKMALILLKNGSKDSDDEVKQLSMFGAGLAASNASIEILEQGLNSQNFQTQMIALNFLSSLNDDRIDDLLNKAMSSDFVPIRLEAAYHMAKRKHPNALGQIESLMYKLPAFVKPYFPTLLAALGSNEAIKTLKVFLNDANPDVRIETILNLAHQNRDDMLTFIKKRAITSSVAEKEAICFALSSLKDTSSIEILKKMSLIEVENVKVQALRSLYLLGDQSAKEKLFDEAKKQSLFAISILSEIEGSEDLLYDLTKSNNALVELNSAISLYKRKDRRSLKLLKTIFIDKEKDLAFSPFLSSGRTMMYIKTLPKALGRIKESNVDLSVSLNIKNILLKESIEYNEDDFLKIASTIIDNNQLDLVPLLITLLENKKSTKVISYLKHLSKTSLTPLIKDYANLSLYRLDEKGDYENYIKNWVYKENDSKLIELNPDNIQKNENASIYDLTKEETSKLLVDMYTALASKQNERTVLILIDAIKKTNFKNRYALSGLLIKATE
jgi:HEAT repeat protein